MKETDEQKQNLVKIEFAGYKIMRHDPPPIPIFKIYKNLYWSDCGLYNSLAWCSCEPAPIKNYEKEIDALNVLQKSKERWPDVEFKIVKAYRLGENIIAGEDEPE
jgi:hypothetical protein